MARTTLGRELRRFDSRLPLERASTPPASWYIDPDMHALERAAVFGGHWQFVARADQLAKPGDQVGGVHAGAPWLVTRGRDDVLRAFRGVCRHKAAVLLDAAQNSDVIHCPYHGWSYDLEGALSTAPGIKGIQDFDRADCRLPSLQVAQWGPLILLRAQGQGLEPAEQFPEVDACLSASGWAGLRFATRRTWDLNCNWKVFCDNYLDGGLHIPNLHPSLEAQVDMGSYAVELFEQSSLQTAAVGTRAGAGAGEGLASGVDVARRIGGGAAYAFVFPNLMINRYGPVLDTNLVLPLAHDRCRVVFDVWFEDGVDDDFIAASLAQTETTQEEDVGICESVQIGLQSGAYDRGRYAPASESAVYHFHRELAAALNAAL